MPTANLDNAIKKTTIVVGNTCNVAYRKLPKINEIIANCKECLIFFTLFIQYPNRGAHII